MTRLRNGFLIAAVVIFLTTAVTRVWGQGDTATVQGTVKDRTGALVAGATLTARNVDTNFTRTAVSGTDGTYRFDSLPVGNYEFKTEAAGFQTAINQGITLTVAQHAVLEMTMDVGALDQQVEVTGEATQQVNTASAELGAVVNEAQVKDLPLNGRNYVQLALLQAGVTEQKNRVQNATANLASQGTFYSSNGAPTRSNRYLLDGTNLSEYGFATASSISGTTLGIDGIREFKILSGGFDAQYGMSMGSQMLVVSKGGTNSVHGDVFGFLRNSALNARNYFDTSATSGLTAAGVQRRLPPFRQLNFGAAAGGPIKKDKTFIYAVYEGIRELQGLTELNTTIPTGCRGAAGAVITPANCPLITASQTVSPEIAQFLSLTPPSGLAPIFPQANATIGSVTYQNAVSWGYGSQTQEDYGQARVDQVLSQKDNLFGRFTIDNDSVGLPEAQPGFPTFPTSRGQWATIAENHVFSPALLNTFTFGYSRSDIHLGGPAYYSGPGYSYAPTGPANESANGAFEQGTLTIGGAAANSPGGLYVSEGKQSIFSYSDDLYLSKGKQSLKFGTLINRFQIEAVNGTGTNGTLTFLNYTNFLDGNGGAGCAGTPSATNCQPLASSYGIFQPGFNDRKDVRFWTLGFYGQDDIKVNPRLTVNLGMRYEPNTNMIVLHNLGTSIRNPLVDDQPTVGNKMMEDPSWHNFSPRFGFAWDPIGDGKTAIRGSAAYLQNVSTWIGFLHLSIKELPEENPVVITAPSSGTGVGETFTLPYTVNYASLPLTARNPTSYHYDAAGQQPRGLQYTFSVQRQLPFQSAFTLAYTGSRNWGLITYTQGNPTMPAGVPGVNAAGQETCVPAAPGSLPTVASQNYTDGKANACWWGGAYPTNAALQTAFPGVYSTSLLPESWINQNWGNISYLQASGQSWYNSMQATLDKRLSHGLQFQVAFTWSRLFDTTESQSSADAGSATSTNQLDPLHPENDRSPATFDVPITLRINAIYNLPTANSNRFVNGVLNGWRILPIYQAQSGSTFDLGFTQQRSLPIATGGSPDRPDWVPGRNSHNATHGTSSCTTGAYAGAKLGTPKVYYDPCAFYGQPKGFYGNMGRDSLRGPDYATVDLSLVKDTRLRFLGEAGALEFRVEGFNVLNRANFGTPARTVFPGSGPVTNDVAETPVSGAAAMTNTLSTSRQLQFAAKVIF